jgi:Right handed beta helix region
MAITIPAGFPDASSSGVPAGTALKTYTGPMTISTDGAVIEGMIINGPLRVTGDNVVIKNCIITFNGYWGVDAEGATNITIQNCDIIGPGSSGAANAAILGSGNFLGNDISKTENGIVLQDGASVVKGNYIHDLLSSAGNNGHYDGLSVQGGQNGVLIEGNTIIARDTSNIIICDDFGSVNNVTVNHNYLGGDPGYNIYSVARHTADKGWYVKGVSITNNVIEEGGAGYFSIANSTTTHSGNVTPTGVHVDSGAAATAPDSIPDDQVAAPDDGAGTRWGGDVGGTTRPWGLR